jgi:hypothetical protein
MDGGMRGRADGKLGWMFQRMEGGADGWMPGTIE